MQGNVSGFFTVFLDCGVVQLSVFVFAYIVIFIFLRATYHAPGVKVNYFVGAPLGAQKLL